MTPPCLHRLVSAGLLAPLLAGLGLGSQIQAATPRAPIPNARPPATDAELQYWLDTMVRYHRFRVDEVIAATGMTEEEVNSALGRFQLVGARPEPRRSTDALRVLPYPGGRHPRIGFLEGAIDPQRETKFSVFAPWSDTDYVVVDVPEALWSNLGLTYLAHTHIPTLWSQQDSPLPRLEWNRRPDGSLDVERTLPNGIAFGTRVIPRPGEVRMELWLRNGSDRPLTGLRVQNCIMLKSAAGFAEQTLTNKVFQPPYAAVRSDDGRRWIITAWHPADRCWGNDQVPCLHADPRFPDCAPGKTVRLRGWLSFLDAPNLDAELKRIEGTGWRSGS